MKKHNAKSKFVNNGEKITRAYRQTLQIKL